MKKLTGGKVLAIALSAFAVVVAANMTLAVYATGGFPGLVTDNAYASGQRFDADRKRLEAHGWSTGLGYQDGILRLGVDGPSGRPVRDLGIVATVGRADSKAQTVPLVWTGRDYAAPVPLAPGRWRVAVDIADGTGEAPLRLSGRVRADADE